MAQYRVDEKSGNCILICGTCKGETDKGCPPIKGQDDAGGVFRCESCQQEINRAALKKAIDTLEISADDEVA